ncbi:MAG: hypothetical protein E7615_06640 [Ruminococcaceae bacterium]|nr:hypothetical protein [Oscillospiraceae bacterium]
MKTYTQEKAIVRVQVLLEKNIFFVRTNRKLKVCLKNRKKPDKIRVFLWLYLFCSPLMSMGCKKDIFGIFAYEFELLRFLSEAQGFTLRDAMLSHRDVAHFVRSDVMFGATRPKACITDRRSASRTQCASLARKGKHR